jgi:MFS family permease
MNIVNCSNSHYAVQPALITADRANKRKQQDNHCLIATEKKSFFKALMPQGFPTNYAQLVVSVFFLGSFIGENIINPVAATVGKRPVAFFVMALFVLAATVISNLSANAMANVVKGLQFLAILAGVLSLLYSLQGGASVVPFHELVNSGAAAKNLLLIMLIGVVLGTHSTQIKESLSAFSVKYLGQSAMVSYVKATVYDAKKTVIQPVPKLDKLDLSVVSSDEYLFSSLYE